MTSTSPTATGDARTQFLDTSAIFALVEPSDRFHGSAGAALSSLQQADARLVSTSYVLHESLTLLQRRQGLPIVRRFIESIAPLIDTFWIDAAIHDKAVAALLTANRRKVSLTDWSSFEVMRHLGLTHAFAFDDHFAEQGFKLFPGPHAGES